MYIGFAITPTSQGPIELTGVLLRNWDTILILVAPKPLKGTVNPIVLTMPGGPLGIVPISSPGSKKSPSIFQSIYTLAPEG